MTMRPCPSHGALPLTYVEAGAEDRMRFTFVNLRGWEGKTKCAPTRSTWPSHVTSALAYPQHAPSPRPHLGETEGPLSLY